MIVFDSNVCPNVISATILGEMLQFAKGVHILFVKSSLYAEVFKERYALA